MNEHTFFAATKGLDVIRLLALAMRLGRGAHKLPLIGPHDIRVRQILVQNLPDQTLGRLARVMSNLLSRACIGGLRRAISHGEDHSLRDSSTLRGRRDSISKLGDDTKVELFLSLLWHGQAQDMA